MPLMTDKLAHFAMVLDDIKADIEHKKSERDRLDAKISILEEYKHKVRSALDEEAKKLKP